MDEDQAYRVAQRAVADLKSAIRAVLRQAGSEGLRNVDVGNRLGIYRGHSHTDHYGQIPWTLLKIMEMDGVVKQGEDQRWRLASVEATE